MDQYGSSLDDSMPHDGHGISGIASTDGFSEGNLSSLSTGVDGPKSKYSELLRRKNLRNQLLVENQQRQILAQ